MSCFRNCRAVARAEVTRRLLGGTEVDEVLEFATQQTLEMTGADLVVLALPDAARGQLTIRHAAGDGAQEALGLELPTEGSLSGKCWPLASRSWWKTSATTSGRPRPPGRTWT
jgi:GAF domain-containing protein